MYVKNFFSVKHMARYSQSRCAENFFVVLKIFFLFLRSRPVVGVFWWTRGASDSSPHARAPPSGIPRRRRSSVAREPSPPQGTQAGHSSVSPAGHSITLGELELEAPREGLCQWVVDDAYKNLFVDHRDAIAVFSPDDKR